MLTQEGEAMNMKEINNTIYELENGDTNHAACQKLAALYIVRDHAEQKQETQHEESIPKISDSEFMKKAASVDSSTLWKVLDEGMTTLSAINPRLYSAILNKLS